MNSQRIIGVVLLVVGVVLVAVGMNATHSLADKVSYTFSGRLTEATTWYIIGGGAAALFGVLLVVFGFRHRNA